jgi:tetratricopeptide (TPR) repeat protein
MPTARPLSVLPATSPRRVWLLGLALVLAIFVAYANSLDSPFLYDDGDSLVDNPTLNHLGDALFPPNGGYTVSGRPVLNFSFALNRALGGPGVRSYHVGNILVHALASLALFGVLLRAFSYTTALGPRASGTTPVIAFATALLWALHPLQTESVTYLVQRAESLMGLFYLATLYFFLRSTQSPTPARWQVAAFTTCLLGMATKENMVSVPLIVLLLDRALVAGSFAQALRARRWLYLGLVATWVPLAALVLGNGGNRGGSAGFGLVAASAYWFTQFPALLRYLTLTVWPQSLVFDYGTFWITEFSQVAGQACVVAAMVAATCIALFRRPLAGAIGVFFFAVLAPTSLVPVATQMIVEHRMYLPLAGVLALVVPATCAAAGRRALFGFVSLALGFGALTIRRNTDYRTDLSIWWDTLAKRPNNAAAHCSFGNALTSRGRSAEAMAEYRRALQINPNYTEALVNLGDALTESGNAVDALSYLEAATRFRPRHPEAHLNLGVALDYLGRTDEAMPHYELALRLKPQLPAAHNAFGSALLRRHQIPAAMAEFETALQLDPDYAGAHYNLAVALAQTGRMADAESHFARGLQLRPESASARVMWANTLLELGRGPDAIAQYEAVLQFRPDYFDAHYNLGNALAAGGRFADAISHYREALRTQPDSASAHNNLANALTMLGRDADAVPQYEASLRARPDDPNAHNNVGLALARLGRIREAVIHFESAVRLAPDFAQARENLAHARAQLAADPLH